MMPLTARERREDGGIVRTRGRIKGQSRPPTASVCVCVRAISFLTRRRTPAAAAAVVG